MLPTRVNGAPAIEYHGRMYRDTLVVRIIIESIEASKRGLSAQDGAGYLSGETKHDVYRTVIAKSLAALADYEII